MPNNYNENSKILSSTLDNHLNGRVDILNQPSPNVWFSMMEKTSRKNKATSYVDALSNVWEDTQLSVAYFSAANMQIIQNGIRAGVYKMSNNRFIVAPPNPENLKIIMRSVFLQYVEYSVDKSITEQVDTLNQIVLSQTIPRVFNEAIGYSKYCEDQSTLVQPLDLPVKSDRVYKQLETKPWV